MFNRVTGFSAFLTIWFGQILSLVGAGISTFAIGVWVYNETKSVTLFSLIALFSILPDLVLSPIAGVYVDRWNKKYIMIASDLAGGLITLILALTIYFGSMELVFIYIAVALHSIFKAFQWLAYYSSISVLVPKKHIGRSSGMISMAEAATKVLSPILGASFYGQFGLFWTVTITFITYLIGVLTLSVVKMPQEKKQMVKTSVKEELVFGWKYITSRLGLFYLLIFFFFYNIAFGMNEVLMTPLIMKLENSKDVLGIVMTTAGIGMLLGGIVQSIWGGPQKKIRGILLSTVLVGICIIWQGLFPNVISITIVFFMVLFCSPIMAGCSQSIWQVKVASDVQGRVFAFRGTIAWASLPISYSLAGPFADKVFEPMLSHNGLLATSVGAFIGIGPGRGIAFLMICLGICMLLIVFVAMFNPRLLNVEKELPDHLREESIKDVNVENEVATKEVIN
ncbi:Predicted arabinose efflux permease, MFS family [Marininema mesophilum]|uniref:Predicted arabinose efflux permease, MFS family n=1 Tax=Marininema mesophilum TaxID=1048340 RepID=A0A1H2YH27_9BACL|nr:MFS transporter [Marininema mesophilum]SDX04380.1 Predicted arabinose efflux permease, MFS family [Marininema mesophilum]